MKTILFFISLGRGAFREQLEGIYRYARAKDWHVQVVENSVSKEQVRKAVEVWKPCGVFAEFGDRTVFHDCKLFKKIPIVYFDIGRRMPHVGHYVSFDSASAGRAGAEHLLKLGFGSYAYVSYYESRLWDRERGDAFCSTVREAGARCAFFPQKGSSARSDRHERLLAFLRSLPLPCGLMAANDRVAEEVVNACTKLRISIPDDLAVIGVDNDLLLCENQRPTLSSVVPNIVQEGFCAAEMLDRLIVSGMTDKGLELVKVPPRAVVVRQSTRCVNIQREKVGVALEMIRRQATEGISVRDVVASMGWPSRRKVERVFRAATGHSILEEIVRVRLDRVYELLSKRNVVLGAVAHLTGFKTEAALRKAFRQAEGCSMRDWRKRRGQS